MAQKVTVTKDELMIKVTAAGLDDAQIFEAIRFAGLEDFVKALYPCDEVELEPDAEAHAKILLCTASTRAAFSRRVEDDGLPGGLSDSLWAAGVAREKARKAEVAEPPEAFVDRLGKGPAKKRQGPASWQPSKRPKPAGGLVSADLALTNKWGGRLGLALQGTPAADLAEDSGDAFAFFVSLIGKARPSTVKKRVRDWELFVRWLSWTEGSLWPSSVKDAIGYLNYRLAEGCPVSFPASFWAAMRWVESRSGLPPSECYGRHSMLKLGIERAVVVLGTNSEAVRKAPRIPLVIVAALEKQVVSGDVLGGIRILAWMRLVKIYGSLRADDLQRLRPRDVNLASSGLTGVLTQTKTSGAGRKVRALPLFVPRCAYIVQERWLEVGYGLWRTVGDPGRDFFLPRLGADYNSFDSSPASTADMAILNKVVLQRLQVPVSLPSCGGGKGHLVWKEGPYCLIKSPLCDGWTGHSERCTMPSLLASMGVPKAERDPLGRWSPSGSDDYVRTYRALIRDLMGRFRRAAALGELASFAEEEEAIEEARVFANRFAAYSDAEVSDAVVRLVESSAAVFAALEGKTVEVEPPTYEEATAAAEEGPGGWESFASGLASRSKGSRLGLGQPLDHQVASSALDLWQGDEGQGHDDPSYQPAVPYVVAVGKGGIRRLHRTDGCWKAKALAFKEYDMVDEYPAPQELYSHYCRKCWPLATPPVPEESDGCSVSSASSSSSGA
jgi:hypothetical protein